jgi:hypothetical protein
MAISPSAFPLDSTAFASALRTGHGRAFQQVQRYGAEGLGDTLLDACIRSGTYDPQCEAPRAPWLFSIVECAGLQARLVQALGMLLQKAPTEDDDHRDLTLRSAMLRELAAAGSTDARQWLYASLVRLPETSSGVIAADDIVALDGMDGLVHVARQMGRWSQQDPHFWVDDVLVERCMVSGGAPAALAALEQAAATDPCIGHYLQALAETRALRSSHSRGPDAAAFTAEQVVAYARDHAKDPCHWFRQWALRAEVSELEVVFLALLDVQDPEHAARLLRCFAQRGVPRFDNRLLPWLDHPEPAVNMAALRAIKFTRHPALRSLALRWMADGDSAGGMRLLTANFEAGDFALHVPGLQSVGDMDERHHLGSNIVGLCETHPSADAVDALLDVYEFSPCSTCRHKAVKVLVDLDRVPDWLREEARWDADPATRALLPPGGDCPTVL